MMPARTYPAPKPAQVKRVAAAVKHISAPLKGLSLSSKLTVGDPLTASVLDNWIVEENLIRCRPGTRLTLALPDADAVESFVPFHGSPQLMAAANAGKLTLLSGTVLATGFLGDDWSWSSFSNLSATDYTVMVNGIDGVWSWDGTPFPAGVVKETVTAPVGEPWINPDQFNIVIAHMNRLWFADSTNLAVYYLPVQQKSGEVAVLPLNAIFKRGGHIRAIHTWTTEGAENMNDQLVIFTSNGECAIYGGVDPATDFGLSGLFRFDAPMSKHSVVNYGGELYVMISTGLVPMSTLMRAESEQLGQADKNVISHFQDHAKKYRNRGGWQTFLDPGSGHVICNLPHGSQNDYHQLVRKMNNPIWTQWSELPTRCWGWIDSRIFMGSDDGKIYEMSATFLSDDGQPIRVDVQGAWANFGTPAVKQFKMVLPYIQSDGTPRPYVDIKVDYDMSEPTNQPDVTFADVGADWDLADWGYGAVEGSSWSGDTVIHNNWSGVAALGHVGAPRLVALVSNAEFTLNGWDVLFETGSIFG